MCLQLSLSFVCSHLALETCIILLDFNFFLVLLSSELSTDTLFFDNYC